MNIVSKAPSYFFPVVGLLKVGLDPFLFIMWLYLRTNPITHTEQGLTLLVYKITYIDLNK